MTITAIPQILPTVAELVSDALDRKSQQGISQRELAMSMGYPEDRVSMLSMVKRGKTKLALDKIYITCEVLDIDPLMLLAAVLREKTTRTGDSEKAWPFIQEVLMGTLSDRELLFAQALKNVEKKTGKEVPINELSVAQLESFVEREMLV